jgi:hypothetical protein
MTEVWLLFVYAIRDRSQWSVDFRGGVLGRRMRLAGSPWRVHEGEPVPHVDQTIYERRLLLRLKHVIPRHIIYLVTLNCWTSHTLCSPTNNGYLLWVVDLYDAINKSRYYLHVSVASPNGCYCLPSAWLLESTKYLSTVTDSTQLIYFN